MAFSNFIRTICSDHDFTLKCTTKIGFIKVSQLCSNQTFIEEGFKRLRCDLVDILIRNGPYLYSFKVEY